MANETVQFREVHNRVGGASQEISWEYRVREVIISVLGVSLSTWGDWQKVEFTKVDQNNNPL